VTDPSTSTVPAPPAEDAGWPTVHVLESVASEYAGLRKRVIVVDRSARGRMRLTGARAVETLSGLVTNALEPVGPGQGTYAAALTAKGKIIADLRIFVDDGSILVDCGGLARAGWMATVRKFVNPRVAPYQDVYRTTRDIGVFGPGAIALVAEALGAEAASLAALPPYGHLTLPDPDRTRIARVPDLGVDGFDLFLASEAFDARWSRLLAAGAVAAGIDACEVARVEAGRPEWGIDIDEATLPQEARLEELGALSFAKGCYVGQEVVARIHFRGHVNRRLVGLGAATAAPPQRGARLFDGDDKDVGDVRSAVTSPRLGGIALGMLRREIAEGTRVTARWPDGALEVEVQPLPFPD